MPRCILIPMKAAMRAGGFDMLARRIIKYFIADSDRRRASCASDYFLIGEPKTRHGMKRDAGIATSSRVPPAHQMATIARHGDVIA